MTICALFALVVFVLHNEASGRINSTQEAQIAACKRGNDLREESNARIEPARRTTEAVIDFLKTSEKFRREAGNLHAAAEARLIASDLKESAQYKPVSMVDCEQVILHPSD